MVLRGVINMTERDSYRQIRPKDGITLQYRTRDDGKVVWETRIANLPQWRNRFENSPILPNVHMVDTTNVVPGDKNSHITFDAPHIGEPVKVKLNDEGRGAKELPEDVTVFVDAAAITKKYRNHGSGSGRARRDNELASFHS